MSSSKKQSEATEFVTLKEAIQILGLSPVWVRRMYHEKKLEGKLIETVVETEGGSYTVPKIFLTRTSVESKRRELQAKEDHREAVRSGKVTYDYQRPSQRTISMMRSKVARDQKLTPEERATMDALLARYEGEWEAEYLAKVADQTADQS